MSNLQEFLHFLHILDKYFLMYIIYIYNPFLHIYTFLPLISK